MSEGEGQPALASVTARRRPSCNSTPVQPPATAWRRNSPPAAGTTTDFPSVGTGPAKPLSCPADAYNTGVGLVRLEPGQTWTAQWGIESRLA